jgi:hypothetical protein
MNFRFLPNTIKELGLTMALTTPPPAPLPHPNEAFALDFSVLAREIAMDIFPIDQVLKIHQVTTEEWLKISQNPRFIATLDDMIRQWNAASNTKERVRVKAATGLEIVLEEYIYAIKDPNTPANHKVEAGKFLAKLGELDGAVIGGGQAGGGITINISTSPNMPPLTIEATANPREVADEEDVEEWVEQDDEVSIT